MFWVRIHTDQATNVQNKKLHWEELVSIPASCAEKYSEQLSISDLDNHKKRDW